MELTVSFSRHSRPGTDKTSDWRSATGREFEFMIMAAAIANFLEEVLSDEMGRDVGTKTYLCRRLSLKTNASSHATTRDTTLMRMKNRGMIHSSKNSSMRYKRQIGRMRDNIPIPAEREKATLEKRRQGVKKFTFMVFSCCKQCKKKIRDRRQKHTLCVVLSRILRRVRK